MSTYGTSGHRPLSGSERLPALGAVRQSSTDPTEKITVSVRLRRRPGAEPLPHIDALRERPIGTPPLVDRDEFADRFGADPADVAAVGEFAREFGLAVGQTSLAGRTVQLTGTAAQLSQAFGVELASYELPDGSSYRGREGAVHLPAALHEAVEGVFGLDNRPQARPLNVQLTAGGTGPSQTVTGLTPPRVAALYGFPTSSAAGQTIGLLEFGGGFRMSDINAFFGSVGQPVPAISTVDVDGATNSPGSDAGADGEVALDIDVAGSVGRGANLAVYFAPWTEQGWVDVVTAAVHDPVNRPSVLSISWGWAELRSVNGLTWTQAAIEIVNATFQEAAALGVTVLAASGDSGSDCQIGNRRAHVLYPASDPYVLCCGGTRISNVSGPNFTETTWAASFGTTGGGVSDAFGKPAWQLWAGIPPNVNDRHIGRGIPDLAGNADPASGYSIVVDGSASQFGGTSAVAPLYAGLVAILNADLREPVGYLNPNLYMFQNSPVFRDTADGASNATNGAPGYLSVPGWDACTGLGSLRGDELLLALRGVGEPPALAECGNKLYLAWKSTERDDRMYYSSYDGSSWAAQAPAPGGSSAGPALTTYQGKLFAAWKGVLGDEGIYWSTLTGTTWATQQTESSIGTSTGVSLATLNGLIYMIWKGIEGDQAIYWRTFDGTVWTPQQQISGVATSHGPSLAVFNGRLYAAWKGMWDDQGIWWSSFDGASWAPQQRVSGVGSSAGPSLLAIDGRLLAGWKGILGDQGIWWSTFDGSSWTPQRLVPRVATSMGPGLGSFNGTAVMAWKGMWGDQEIWWSSFTGLTWRPQRRGPGVGTSPDLVVATG